MHVLLLMLFCDLNPVLNSLPFIACVDVWIVSLLAMLLGDTSVVASFLPR